MLFNMSEQTIPDGSRLGLDVAYDVAIAIQADMDMYLDRSRTMNPDDTLLLGMRIGEKMVRTQLQSESSDTGLVTDSPARKPGTENTEQSTYLVPHTSLEAAIRTPVDEFEIQARNRAELAVMIAEITAPYDRLFHGMLPSPEANQRNWRGVMKEGLQTLPEWHTTIQTAGREDEYKCSITYKPAEDFNRVTDFAMVMKAILPREPHDKRLIMRAGFEGRQMSSLSLSMSISDEYNGKYAYGVTSGSSLARHALGFAGSDMDSLGNLIARVTPIAKVKIELQTDKPSIIFEEGGDCRYQYDAMKDNFVLIGSNEYIHTPEAVYDRPAELSKQQFLAITASALKAIPTLGSAA